MTFLAPRPGTNLAVEVMEAAPSARADLTLELLQEEERRPAIVYTPTRAQSTALALQLGRSFPCGAYHAGLRSTFEHGSFAYQSPVQLPSLTGRGISGCASPVRSHRAQLSRKR